MKASQLRIGNLFYLPNGEVGTISYHEIRLMVVALDKPNYQPIPLTEEWLLKLGFQQVRPCYLVRNGFIAGLDGDDFANCMWTIIISKALPVKIKYVHQLQNLYFAITGEELTLNP